MQEIKISKFPSCDHSRSGHFTDIFSIQLSTWKVTHYYKASECLFVTGPKLGQREMRNKCSCHVIESIRPTHFPRGVSAVLHGDLIPLSRVLSWCARLRGQLDANPNYSVGLRGGLISAKYSVIWRGKDSTIRVRHAFWHFSLLHLNISHLIISSNYCSRPFFRHAFFHEQLCVTAALVYIHYHQLTT